MPPGHLCELSLIKCFCANANRKKMLWHVKTVVQVTDHKRFANNVNMFQMFSYGGKVISLTFFALCAVNFIGKRIPRPMKDPLVGKNLQQTLDFKRDSIEFDPFTGERELIYFSTYLYLQYET